MKILVTGASGQVGWELSKRGARKGFDILALDRATLDITDPAAVNREVSESGASVVVNAAAYTAVDQAESEPELAFAVNRDGPAYLASACAEIGVTLIHISTDFVFDGEKQGPYLEKDSISPLSIYGESKAAGEKMVREALEKHLIIRTSWVYGRHGSNFVKTMLRMGCDKEVIQVVADQYGSPTYAADIGDTILEMALRIKENIQIPWGTYHYCGKGVTTWHGFAEEILDLAREHIELKVRRIEPITTAQYPTPAKRPANSTLDCSLLKTHFGLTTKPWQESLSKMLDQILPNSQDPN